MVESVVENHDHLLFRWYRRHDMFDEFDEAIAVLAGLGLMPDAPTAPLIAAEQHGIRLELVKLPDAKRGFVLLPRR